MAFKTITPYMRQVSPVTALVRELANGDVVIWVSFAEHHLKDFNQPTHAAVECDDETHQIKVTFNTEGPFKLKKMVKGGARLQFEAFGEIDQKQESEWCTVEERGPNWFTCSMPRKWLDAVTPSRVVSTPPPRINADEPALNNGKVNAVTYLRSKGVIVSKLAGDFWQHANQRIDRVAVLKMVNAQRQKAELPPLTLSLIE